MEILSQMKSKILLFCLISALLDACAAIDYMVTVEQPVTLAAFNGVLRQNGTCCSPTNSTYCTICPDDPTTDFSTFVCFRTGFVTGSDTDIDFCPLGGVPIEPNNVPGAILRLTPRTFQAPDLPRQYPGAIQLLMRISGTRNGSEVQVDDVLVTGFNIAASSGFRQLSVLSANQIALVGVNVRVECTNGATTDDCSTTGSGTTVTPVTETPTSSSQSSPLDYMLTVERPVTLVPNNRVQRLNGSCCPPGSSTSCTICPDDPSIDFHVVVCFRGGGVVGFSRNVDNCPLGRINVTANDAIGTQLPLTPGPGAQDLPRQYPGAVQLTARITGIVNSVGVILDDAWVFRSDLRAGSGFRRIARLSFNNVAIVGVNVRVDCTNGVNADCSVPAATQMPTTTEMGTILPGPGTEDIGPQETTTSTSATEGITTSEESTTEVITPSSFATMETTTFNTRDQTTEMNTESSTTANTATFTQTSSTKTNITNSTPKDQRQGSLITLSPQSIGIGVAIGIIAAAVITTALYSMIVFCVWKRCYHQSKHDISKDGEIEVKRNPTYDIRLNPMVVSEDLPTYQEIPAVATKPTIVEDVL